MGKILALSFLAPFLLILPTLAILELCFVYSLIFDGESSTGKVISYDARTQVNGTNLNRRTHTAFFPVIEFSAHGKLYRATAEIGSNGKSFDLGATVDIRYLKSNPNRVVIQGFFYSMLRPLTLFVFSFLLCCFAFKIFLGHPIELLLKEMKSVLFIPGAIIAMLFGFVILALGFNTGWTRLGQFRHGTIENGIIVEANLETIKEEFNFFGKKIKSSHQGSRIIAEYIDPSSGAAVQEVVFGDAKSKAGSEIQFLKIPEQQSIEMDLPWFYITPVVLLACGWAFFVLGLVFIL